VIDMTQASAGAKAQLEGVGELNLPANGFGHFNSVDGQYLESRQGPADHQMTGSGGFQRSLRASRGGFNK